MTGCGSGCSFGLIVVPQAAPLPANQLQLPRWVASLTFSRAGGYEAEGKLSEGTLAVKDVGLKGVPFGWLAFGRNDKLREFSRKVAIAGSEREMVIGGNTSGRDGEDFYYVIISEANRRVEDPHFSPDLTIKARSVRYPDGTNTRSREVYDRGELVKRAHYTPFDAKTGTTSIALIETFPAGSDQEAGDEKKDSFAPAWGGMPDAPTTRRPMGHGLGQTRLPVYG